MGHFSGDSDLIYLMVIDFLRRHFCILWRLPLAYSMISILSSFLGPVLALNLAIINIVRSAQLIEYIILVVNDGKQKLNLFPTAMPPTRTEPTPAGEAWHPFKKQRSKIMRMNREEDDEEVEPQPQPLTVQRLKGAVPPSQVPCAHAVDHENQIVFFNTFEDDTTNGSEIFACTLETGIWKNVTVSTLVRTHAVGVAPV